MCLPAVVAVEVVGVVGVVLEQQRLLLNDGVTLLTDVLAETPSFLPVVTRTTQVPDGKKTRKKKNKKTLIRHSHGDKRRGKPFTHRPSGILNKSHVGEHSLADVAAETVWMPTVVHGLDHAADDELALEIKPGKKESSFAGSVWWV